MKYTVESNLRDFEFWGGATSRVALLTSEQLDAIEQELTDNYFAEELPTDMEINDLFWHDFEFVVGLIGLEYGEDGKLHDPSDDEEDWGSDKYNY